MTRTRYTCANGHEMTAETELKRCYGCVNGKPCTAELSSHTPNKRAK